MINAKVESCMRGLYIVKMHIRRWMRVRRILWHLRSRIFSLTLRTWRKILWRLTFLHRKTRLLCRRQGATNPLLLLSGGSNSPVKRRRCKKLFRSLAAGAQVFLIVYPPHVGLAPQKQPQEKSIGGNIRVSLFSPVCTC